MRYVPSAFESLLKVIDRRAFQALVALHDADAYDKSFGSWDHLVAMVFAQLSAAASLRHLVETWNAGANHHYHLGCCDRLARSTLADANERRPVAVFAELFAGLLARLDRQTRRDGAAMVRLIDSTPIPLGKLYDWAKTNGRIRGMKVHVLYDPAADAPRIIDITDANVNDAQVGRTIEIVPGATYVFDKGYCHYAWWAAITATALFVTRPKTSMKLEVVRRRGLQSAVGEGCTILADEEVRLASKGDSKLDIPLRRLTIRRDDGKQMALITNDLARSAAEVAALYKSRWQIELLFRWIKQHLKIRTFLGRNDNAIRLQIFAAMIAYALLRLAVRTHRVGLPILAFTRLVGRYLLDRRPLAAIGEPPPVNPSRPKPKTCPNQMSFAYAI